MPGAEVVDHPLPLQRAEQRQRAEAAQPGDGRGQQRRWVAMRQGLLHAAKDGTGRPAAAHALMQRLTQQR